MRTPSAKVASVVTIAATPVAALVAAGIIWQSSYAAFSGQTRNSGNDWATGTVSITDDDAGSARFQVTNMAPGDTDTRCIKVTANASTAGVVKGYVVNPVKSTNGLEDHIEIVMTSGTGGSFAGCTGFVEQGVVIPGASLSQLAAYNSWDSGVGGWPVTAGTQTRTYKITWTFDTEGMTQAEIDKLQGSHTGIDIQWELQTD
jgi:hypothetical protein